MNLGMSPRVRFAALAFLFALAFSLGIGTSAPQNLHTLYGEVRAYNPATKIMILRSNGQNLSFQVTNETHLSSRYGHVTFDKIKRGSGATVTIKVDASGHATAIHIRLEPDTSLAKSLTLFSVKTTGGEVISGMAFNNYVAYQPPSDAWMGGVPFESARESMFIMSVQPDGTVSDVKPLRGLGYPELDARAKKWLKKWRFKPNTITEARMPITYSQWRY
jgi:TonB family protein